MRTHKPRRGVSTPEYAVIGCVILLALAMAVAKLGSVTNDHLQSTAAGVGDPSALAGEFGGSPSDPDNSDNPSDSGNLGNSGDSDDSSGENGGGRSRGRGRGRR